ncbi:MAG: OmpA family protein [Sideroxydans sp.]|nr:OmpA family protein [Sideroxydans sp.]
MKKQGSAVLAIAALTLAVSAQASQFSGAYFGLSVGQNTSSKTNAVDKKSIYPGLKLGYSKDVGPFLMGAEGSADLHDSAYSTKDVVVDGRLGFPMNNWMPYVKLGAAATSPGVRAHGGLGLEYSLSDQWSLNAEFATDSKQVSKVTTRNGNVLVGINGFFSGAANKSGAAAQAAADKAAADAAAAKAAADKAAADAAAAAKAAADKAAADAAAAAKAAADNTAAGRAAAAKAAADKAAADAKAAADKAAADAAAVKAQPAYKTLLTDKPVTLEGASFASGSSKLNPSANGQLDEIVQFTQENKGATLNVIGYTDDRGNAAKNVKLSAARAAAVKAYLVSKGVAANRVTTKGAGSANPVGDNKTDAGRSLNRRVEVKSVITEAKKVLVK